MHRKGSVEGLGRTLLRYIVLEIGKSLINARTEL
jgi:hypothetical protein